jgi:hypothetical protein
MRHSLFGQIRYDESRLQWRLDSDQMTYVIGVNEQKMVQSLYWGSRLSFSSEIPKAKTGAESSSFDPSISTTQLEYPAWGCRTLNGAGIEGDLKQRRSDPGSRVQQRESERESPRAYVTGSGPTDCSTSFLSCVRRSRHDRPMVEGREPWRQVERGGTGRFG